MGELISLYETLNLKNVRTCAQSGNVPFDSTDGNALKLSRRIEEKIQKAFGFSVTVLIRTADALQRLVDNNPFLKKKSTDISKLHVTFLTERPDSTVTALLDMAKN